jgi:hypothetical protein
LISLMCVNETPVKIAPIGWMFEEAPPHATNK